MGRIDTWFVLLPVRNPEISVVSSYRRRVCPYKRQSYADFGQSAKSKEHIDYGLSKEPSLRESVWHPLLPPESEASVLYVYCIQRTTELGSGAIVS